MLKPVAAAVLAALQTPPTTLGNPHVYPLTGSSLQDLMILRCPDLWHMHTAPKEVKEAVLRVIDECWQTRFYRLHRFGIPPRPPIDNFRSPWNVDASGWPIDKNGWVLPEAQEDWRPTLKDKLLGCPELLRGTDDRDPTPWGLMRRKPPNFTPRTKRRTFQVLKECWWRLTPRA
jgi:hypothetical protein